ncbi:MAG TPA: phosphate ABC transporter ATP-binding protein PstB [Parvibaculum sp.]|uniref:phosphate ABC transporter ATP-binding protein PstB n=1 Tax=Parvibaculum sp. TaxID=2024848 RepID=UPI002C923ED7|nr:phosphate ABC transporter ATP-binding protein PstB [Parvibaculum sp.]HMM13970.1 phosphate ABC transporter ATP-binding protein PstB [Parvibaculum sp.]
MATAAAQRRQAPAAGDGFDPTVYHPVESASGTEISIRDFNLWYGASQALHNISMEIQKGMVTALIGPSGCGKSTLLRSLNRMNDLIDNLSVAGEVWLSGEPVFGPQVDVIALRKRMGMVFQKPNPFPMSIAENVTYPLKVDGITNRKLLAEACEHALKGAALWDEVKDRLNDSALGLSGGQQQRLCIARAIAGNPEVLLMDEPCSALDPIATMRIEQLIEELKSTYTIVIVTHNMQQAARVSDNTAFMYLGRLIEYGETKEVFTKPLSRRTEEYVTGRFG